MRAGTISSGIQGTHQSSAAMRTAQRQGAGCRAMRPAPRSPVLRSGGNPAVVNATSWHAALLASGLPAAVRRRSCTVVSAAAATAGTDTVLAGRRPLQQHRPLRVVIAGGGIGGLVLAVALLKKGVDVKVYERDFTAIRGEGKYRGPIQVQSNALAALEAIDADVCEAVLAAGCITGDRINGLCDGETGDWYIKFDTFHPAVSRGLPVTRVISRVTLQEILADAVERLAGPGVIENAATVVGYEHGRDEATGREHVRVLLDGGRTDSADLLIGADGIWSKVRRELLGASSPVYSGYTCYTGISDFMPPDLEIVGYRVFLGNGQYFVSSDVGGGKQQWYAFHKEPADGSDPPGCSRKGRLLDIFGHWCDDVTDLIKATPEDDILRRDINDRPPVFRWTEGRVALLGDSAHAMQPNLGQGGCMAIEDAFRLAQDVEASMAKAEGNPDALDVPALWRSYTSGRLLRSAAIHGMARFAAIMASTYKAYLGEGLGPLAKPLTALRVPHPGRVVGRAVLHATMPAVLSWVLGGFGSALAPARPPACRVEDKLKVFSEDDFATFMRDDRQLSRAAHARWMLLCERPPAATNVDATSSSEAKGIYLSAARASVGGGPGSALWVEQQQQQVSSAAGSPAAGVDYAHVWREEGGDAFVEALPGALLGAWLNGRQLAPGLRTELRPGDVLRFGDTPDSAVESFKLKLQHVSLGSGGLNGQQYTVIPAGGQARAPSAAKEAAAAVVA